MNIVALFEQQASVRPGQPAIIDVRGQRYRIRSYRQLAEDSARTAALFRAQGLGAGDRVLVVQPMGYELYVVLLALLRLGAVAMVLDPAAGRETVASYCRLGEPTALVAGRRDLLRHLVSPRLCRLRRFAVDGYVPGAVALSQARQQPRLEDLAAGGQAPALFTLVRNEQGVLRRVLRSHDDLIAIQAALAAALDHAPGESELSTLPLAPLANLISGMTSVIPAAPLHAPARVAPQTVFQLLKAFDIRRSAGAPVLYRRLVEYCERAGRELSLTHIHVGGAPVLPPALARIQQATDGAVVAAVHGGAEALPLTRVMYREYRQVDLAAMQAGGGLLTGKPVDGLTLRVIRDRYGSPIGPYDGKRFAAEALPPGRIGEVVACGAHLVAGYLNAEGDVESKFEVDGRRWHRTGEAGYLDAEGRLWLVGRCRSRIDDSRGRLYPFSVECAASFLDGVRRSAMLTHAGRRILLVEGVRGLDVEALRRALAWAQLDEVRRVRAIPVDARQQARVDYARLAARLK